MELIIAGLNMGNCEDTDKKIRNLSNYMIGRRSYKHDWPYIKMIFPIVLALFLPIRSDEIR